MSDKISKNIVTPFSDSMIGALIKRFIENGLDHHKLYAEIQGMESDTDPVDSSLYSFVKRGDSHGSSGKSKPDGDFFYDDFNPFWVIVKSEEEPLKVDRSKDRSKFPLTYRIVLNIKGNDKLQFLNKYVDEMKKRGIPFYFKFSKRDKRSDQVMVYTNEEGFNPNLAIINGLTRGLHLGKTPSMYATLKDNEGIGIGESYSFFGRLSPTEAKIVIIKYAIVKYLFDNLDELDTAAREKLEDYLCPQLSKKSLDMKSGTTKRSNISKAQKILTKRLFVKEDYQDPQMTAEDLFEQHIAGPKYCWLLQTLSTFPPEIASEIQRIYTDNPSEFLKQLIDNYKTVATKGWGFSDDIVFSRITHEKGILFAETTPKKDNIEL